MKPHSLKAVRLSIVSLIAAMAAGPLSSCDETSSMGSILVQDSLEVVVNDTSFTATGHSVDADTVISRTITQLLGSIDAPGYGKLSSDFVTQFMPAIELDTAGITAENIDSLKLILRMNLGAFTGDSLAPMGLQVYRLTDDLTSPIYSTFDPQGKYDTTPIGSAVYNFSTLGEPDSIKNLKYHSVEVSLPVALGRELFTAYEQNPANFSSPTLFAKNVFKGIYVKSSYGSGRVVRIDNTVMRMYYHQTYRDETTKKDTTVNYVGNYFAVTPEIVSNNNIRLDMAANIRKSVAEGEAIVLAPSGLDVEIEFPALDIISNYRQNVTNLGVINSLSYQIPALTIANEYNIAPPPNLLMVLKSKKKEFFANSKITDNLTSFYATYDSNAKSYTFTGLREYIINLLDKENITPEDYTFSLIPVTVNTETSSSDYYGTGSTYITSIVPYISTPVMARLDLYGAKITLIYTKQSL